MFSFLLPPGRPSQSDFAPPSLPPSNCSLGLALTLAFTFALDITFTLPEGCCWRFLVWPWVFQSVQQCHSLLSQRGVVGASCLCLGCSKVCNRHVVVSPRGVLLKVLDLALGAPKCATVKRFALPEGCCWRVLIWLWERGGEGGGGGGGSGAKADSPGKHISVAPLGHC